jgi:DNA topoisomerase-3
VKKSVVLAEKPSVARDIARVLNCHKKGNGFLEGEKYIVTWALGHLVTLADPESYDEKYKAWNLEDLPMIPNDLKLVVIKQTSKQFHAVKSQLQRSDVGEIVIATDSAREGELVARWILAKAKVNKPIKRLWISSVTDKAIKEGFQTLRNGKEYENLYYSAVARSEADWYIGLNATRALTTRFNAQLNCGRVQTPTVAMIALRETEIKNFKAQTYYGIEAQTRDNLKLT